ncbi:cupredoxin domain-containing protein [Nitrosopumilus sp. K4]|uniref:cupredoxin domain-containing protein n=1 Tax=Nitrosopumilus sp. K4 TaxID=2795383 RepID=UPI001BA69748|nr:cupredoxin domain-containing protein [Nitrosopumilus sp. K4]QUC64120.1 cupredoxin domain-containing protein [Nitrosopumilus sp. K4]
MNKKRKKTSKYSKGNVISIGVVFCVFVLIGFFALKSFSPVNSEGLVFAPSTNISLKAVKSSQGNYHYQTTRGGKSLPFSEGLSPELTAAKGNLVQIHLINEEKNLPNKLSKHNLNIDAFNVHTKDLSYFQSDSIIFLANQTGTFDYYCSIHPDMKGIITIVE